MKTRDLSGQLILVSILAACFLAGPGAGRSSAAVYTVTKTADTNDGSCDALDCSLREAIVAANASTGVADTIILPAGTYTIEIPGTGEDACATGDLDLGGSVEIQGASAATTVVDAGGIDRVFHVLVGAVAQLSGVTVQGGDAGTDVGGGLKNLGNITLTDCVVSGNGAHLGGGLYNSGPAMVASRSDVNGNTASTAGGGIHNDSYGSVTLTDCTVAGNQVAGYSGDGGGIFNAYAPMTVTNSTVSGNSAPRWGGGIHNDWNTLNVTNSTVSGNVAGTAGGGISNIFAGRVALKHTTLTGNTAPTGSAVWAYKIDDFWGGTGWTRFANTILVGVCSAEESTFSTSGGNIESPGDTCGLTDGTDQPAVADPGIGPLEDNGGSTQTHALLGGSAAIDQARGGGYCPAADQRGVARPMGQGCDVGAYEIARLKGGADYSLDGSDEIGVLRNGMWFLTYSPDYADVDLVKAFGSPNPGLDTPEIGEFNCADGGAGVPDGRTDLALLRKPYSTWQVTLSPDWGSSPDIARTFGTTNHKPIATRRLDTNGDGCSDIGVFRNGCFDVLESPSYAAVGTHVCFGPGTDDPLAGDLDGDGKSDLILWRQAASHFSYRLSSDGYTADHGADMGAGEFPLLGDLNDDGMVDLGSYAGAFSTFRFTYSPDFAGTDRTVTHGVSGDVPVVADVNGDGAADLGIFRDAVARWWFLCSPWWYSTCVDRSFGVSGDQPIHGKPPGMP